ncbi:MAG: NCS2 family permease [Planctomycetes bacterium]|nr:NCS2 family permease [Planctomycetota bacterium]
MKKFLEKTFKLSEAGTNIRTEIRGGAVTFMTMAYIIFVQPAVLSQVGMDYGAVMVATCLSAAVATLLLGLIANYPFALAAAMGENFIFVAVCHKMAGPIKANLLKQGVAKADAAQQALAQVWPIALAVIFLSGTLFLALSAFKFRERIMRAIPESLRYAIATGIGLLIAFVGYSDAGFKLRGVVPAENMATLRNCQILSIVGLAIIGILLVRKVRGAILIGMVATALIGIPLGLIQYPGGPPVKLPPSVAPTLCKLNFPGVFTLLGLEMIFIFFLLDLFDTVGTLVAVGNQAGFIKEDGELPRAGQAFMSDAIGTIVGATMGTSTVTCYIESSSGVADGARTGLANVVTAALFVLAIFFKPVVQMVGGGVPVSNQDFLLPVIAPVLIIVGAAIMQAAAKINWEDYTEAIPSFLTVIIMPVKLSITEGISAGFIGYAVLKIVAGKGKEVDPIFYIFAAVFAVRGALTLFGVIG